MIFREEIEDLQKRSGERMISIIAPMNKVFPDSKSNSTELKNLVNKAKEQLKEKYNQRELTKLFNRMDELMKNMDFTHTSNGIAIFMTDDYEKVLRLPFKPREQVIINKSFQVRDLVFSINRTYRYWILIVTEDPTRLIQGFGPELEEVKDGVFPTHYFGPGEGNDFPVGREKEHNHYKSLFVDQYILKIDEAFFDYIKNDPLPVVLCGADKSMHYFKNHGKTAKHIAIIHEVNNAKAPLHELSKEIWPLVEDLKLKERQELVHRLEESIGSGKYVAGLENAWRAAKLGEIDTLLVSENYSTPAFLTDDELTLELNPNGSPNMKKLEDAVDDLVEEVFNKGGRVVFAPERLMNKHEKIAAITRFGV